MAVIDWEAVRADYIAGMSQSQLSKKYGVPKGSINTRCTREKWVRLQKSVDEKSTSKLIEKVSSKIASDRAAKLTTIIMANDSLSRVLKRISEQLEALENAPVKNLRDMSELAKAISMTTDTMFKQYGLLTATQEHNQAMAEERLRIDREKLELEKAKQDAEDDGEDIEIRIITPEEAAAEDAADAEEA